MKRILLLASALLLMMAAVFAEEAIVETTATMNGTVFPIRLYERHFDVEYPEGITEEMIWNAAETVMRTAPSSYEGVWFVVKNREHTVSSMYPIGSGPEDAEAAIRLVEAVFGSFV